MTRSLTACPACHGAVLPGHTTCLRCGHALAEPVRTCPACGRAAGAAGRFCSRCGQPLDPPPTQVPPPSAPPVPASLAEVFPEPRSYRRPVLVGVAVLGTIIAVLAVLRAIESFGFRPQSTVAAYFAALADRDAAAASRLLAADPDALDLDATGPVLLDPAALRSGGYTPPTDVRIGEVQAEDAIDGEATVAVAFTLTGERHELVLRLQRDEQATALLYHRWRVVGGTYPVTVRAPGVDSVVIAGVTVPFEEGSDGVTVAALPGGYRVTLPEQPLLAAPETTVYVGVDGVAGESDYVDITPTITETAEREIRQQVQAYLRECATRTELQPVDCPLSTYTYGSAEVRDVRWKITSEPDIELELRMNGQVEVRTTNAGEATVTWQEVYSFGTYDEEDTVAIYVSGTVTVSGGTVHFQART